jgi:hypothetical protein
MSSLFDEVEKRARDLTPQEKAALARMLIEQLDTDFDSDAEQLWVDEAQRRYDAYLKGELNAVPGEDAMRRARSRLK